MSAENCGNCGVDVTNGPVEYLCDECATSLGVNRGAVSMRPKAIDVVLTVRRLHRECAGFPPALAEWEALCKMAATASESECL